MPSVDETRLYRVCTKWLHNLRRDPDTKTRGKNSYISTNTFRCTAPTITWPLLPTSDTPTVHVASPFLKCLAVWIFPFTYISIRTTVQTVLVRITPSPFYHKLGLLVYEEVQYCKGLPSLEGVCCLYLQGDTHIIFILPRRPNSLLLSKISKVCD
jgi:hypothetical protein